MSIRFVRAERPFTISYMGATFKLQRPTAEKRMRLFKAAQGAGAGADLAFVYALLEESILAWDQVFDIIAGKMIPYDRAAVCDLPWPILKHLIACLDGEQEQPDQDKA